MQDQSGPRFQTVLIVDDHPLFCDALAMTVQAVSGIARTHHAATIVEAEQVLGDGTRIDLVMLDLNLPDASGLDGLMRLLRKTRAPIIVVSSLTDRRLVASVMQAGAAGFVPKHSQRDVFAAAITALEGGGTYVPEGHVAACEADPDTPEGPAAIDRLSSLTGQQARILQLICEGKLNKQIAYDLSIAETTVKAHVTAIMRKLGVQSRTQAVLLANQVRFDHVLREAEKH